MADGGMRSAAAPVATPACIAMRSTAGRRSVAGGECVELRLMKGFVKIFHLVLPCIGLIGAGLGPGCEAPERSAMAHLPLASSRSGLALSRKASVGSRDRK